MAWKTTDKNKYKTNKWTARKTESGQWFFVVVLALFSLCINSFSCFVWREISRKIAPNNTHTLHSSATDCQRIEGVFKCFQMKRYTWMMKDAEFSKHMKQQQNQYVHRITQTLTHTHHSHSLTHMHAITRANVQTHTEWVSERERARQREKEACIYARSRSQWFWCCSKDSENIKNKVVRSSEL